MKKFLMSLCAMLAMASSTFADDTFSVDPVMLPATYDADVVVRFSFDEVCPGYTFDLTLPSKLEFVTDAGDVIYTAGNCYPEGSSITTNFEGGKLHVAWLHTGGKTLTEQSGVLVSFKVKVKVGQTITDDDLPLIGTLINGTVSNDGGQVDHVADSEFSITITDLPVLDENSPAAPSNTVDEIDMLVKRTINANEWSTICLPFDMEEDQLKAAFGDDVQLMEYNTYALEKEGSVVKSITINFDEVDLEEDGLEANTPYLIKTSQKVTEFEVTAPIEVDEVKVGSTKKGLFIGSYQAGTTVPAKSLFLSEDKFWYSVGLTKMKAFRCYFTFKEVLDAYNQDTAAPVFINIGGETTRLEQLNIDNDDDNYYTLDGRAVKTPGKGVYIHRGKKIIIK